MKIEVTKKELRAITDCVNVTERTLRGETLLSFMGPVEIGRRFGKIDFPALFGKLRNLDN